MSTAGAGAGAGAGGGDSSSDRSVRPPVAFVIGSTGVGKTKLGVDLALRFNGEVINADAMQMYRGLAVATAKVTEEEAKGVPHHLLSFLDPWDQFTVKAFQKRATYVIEDIRSRGKLPIVVGGTMYYVQALLRPGGSTLDEEGLVARLRKRGLGSTPANELGPKWRRADHEGEDSARLHAKLAKVDPVMATRLHERDLRKIQRALEVFDKHGVRYSDLLKEQEAVLAESHASCPYNSRVFWLGAEREVLRERLDKRVDKMLEAGLLEEVRHLKQLLEDRQAEERRATKRPEGGTAPSRVAAEDTSGSGGQASASQSFTTGVLQAIGYKEFAEYLDKVGAAERGEATSEDVKKALTESVDKLKLVTRRYATVQSKFVRNRFEKRGVPLIRLDSSDVARWDEVVLTPAASAVEEMMAGKEIAAIPVTNDAERVFEWTKYECEMCCRTLNGKHEWEAHLRSRAHRQLGRAIKRRRLREARAEASAAPQSGTAGASREAGAEAGPPPAAS